MPYPLHLWIFVTKSQGLARIRTQKRVIKSVPYNDIQDNLEERRGSVKAVSQKQNQQHHKKNSEVVTGPKERCYETVNNSFIRHMHTITAYLTQAVHQGLCHAVCKEYGIPQMADRFIPENLSACESSDIIEFRTRKRQSKRCSKEILYYITKQKKLLLTIVAITTNINAILKASHIDLRCKNLCTVIQRMWSAMSYNSSVY